MTIQLRYPSTGLSLLSFSFQYESTCLWGIHAEYPGGSNRNAGRYEHWGNLIFLLSRFRNKGRAR